MVDISGVDVCYSCQVSSEQEKQKKKKKKKEKERHKQKKKVNKRAEKDDYDETTGEKENIFVTKLQPFEEKMHKT